MFSMAVAGLAKSLIAVTMTLNPAAAHHGPGSYTIRPGDTMSQIAARAYGSGADWPALWWANRRQVPDPDLITAGQRLALPSSHPASSGGTNWSAIAACESGGNWTASTGNGFYGGLQFTEQTWLGYGGGRYASSANLATPAQQIAVAQRVLAGQGIGAWPVCGARG